MAKAFARGRPIAPLVLSAPERVVSGAAGPSPPCHPVTVRAVSRHSAMCGRLPSKSVGASLVCTSIRLEVAAPLLKDRCEGLLDEARPGRPGTIDDDQVAAVIERTLRTTPADATHWSIRSMAAEPASPYDDPPYVGGVRPAAAPQPDLQAVERSAVRRRGTRYRRPFLSPPNRALVLSLDEKSQIQALDREQPVLPMMPGIPERGRTIRAARHDVAVRGARRRIGFVIGKCYKRHRAVEFLNFLRRSTLACPKARSPHRHGRLRHPQDAQDQGVARPPPALSHPLHADFGIVDQSGRALVRRAHQKAAPARRSYLGRQLQPISAPSSTATTKIQTLQMVKSADQILASVSAFARKHSRPYAANLKFTWLGSGTHVRT